MTIQSLLAAFVRVVGLYGMTLALRETGNAIWFWQIAQDGRGTVVGADASLVVYTCVIWIVMIVLIVFSNAIGRLLSAGIEKSGVPYLLHSGVTLGELSQLAYRLAGVILCVLALSDTANTVVWWSGQTIEENAAVPYRLAYHLVGPISTLLMGAALVLIGGKTRRQT